MLRVACWCSKLSTEPNKKRRNAYKYDPSSYPLNKDLARQSLGTSKQPKSKVVREEEEEQ